jgi:putative ABC transport system ATP-binding protein
VVDPVIQAKDLTKVYKMGEIEVHALRGLSMQIERGEIISIMGPSGSGKSTLMNIIGCLDRPTSGDYILDGERVSDLKDDQLATIRNRKVGFVFQTFNLLRFAGAGECGLPLRYAGTAGRRARSPGTGAVGLTDRMNHRPNRLSEGSSSVAIARDYQ